MGEEENSPKVLVKKFYALQEERVQTYNWFEDGFTAYLKGAPNYNFPMYRNLVNEITKAFQGVSQEIICIEKKLTESYQLPMLSSLIRKIQEVEKKKLEVTAQLQIARQNEIDQPTSDYSEEAQELKQKMFWMKRKPMKMVAAI
ncbi:required for excision 1-B domain-containing protein-like isoform X2 [Liolophura sinensis]|uniref:required for excision 1-B domain-containing protein-like isoform X2 n=1 Tax=Liolophura sinensis TaxID=3198878 RepID=UPI00315849D4